MYDFIKSVISQDRILFQEPMSRHTTFRVGGEAACMLLIHSEEELCKLIPYFKLIGQEYFILGNGSNLLVGDKGYHGIVLKLDKGMQEIQVEDTRIRVKAGALLSQTANLARDHGLTGMEFAAGIPGSIGGAVVMNAGAYEGEMKQIVESVRAMNTDGEILTLDNDTMEFGYRTSVIRNRPFVVLEAVLTLQKGDVQAITARMEELAQLRRSKQPLEYASAGSTFKRPEGYFAAKLIEDAGLKGCARGGAQVSEKHAGFVVNKGDATAKDVCELTDYIKSEVMEKFGIGLELEVVKVGF